VSKIEKYKNIVRDKVEGTGKITPKIRIYLDLKIEELGLSKEIAEICEQELLQACDDETDSADQATVEKYLKKAEQGDVEAQFIVGQCYFTGDNVEEDDAEALKWYRKAAEQGHADAQNSLGNMYYIGVGVTKDDEEAATWYRKSADQGHAEAQLGLGHMYAAGVHFRQNDTAALKLYMQAAEGQNSEACIIVASWYLTGRAVKQDFSKAREYVLKCIAVNYSDREDICSKLLKECVDYFSDNPDCYDFSDVPDDKRDNAADTFLSPFEDDEEVIFFYDATVWGSAKDGFAIGPRQISWKDYLDDTIYHFPLSWTGFKNIVLPDSGLQCDDPLYSIPNTNSDEVRTFLARLIELLHLISVHND
jgi:hypothetical protein